MEVEFLCRECNRSNQVEADAYSSQVSCAACGKNYGALSGFTDTSRGVLHCGICSCRDLYTQKDWNRKLGCAIVAVGAVLAPFTKLISLLICALVDLALYLVLPSITICYRCRSIFREFPLNPAHESFNLGINDRYRSLEKPGR
jgi:hypothetical protein